MPISIFDMFRVGIGPSSSHTVGPMRAGKRFVEELHQQNLFKNCDHVVIQLKGSLAATGKGHATDHAVMLGLMGHLPDTIAVSLIASSIDQVQKTKQLLLDHTKPISFDPETDIQFHPEVQDPYHTNAMEFYAFNDKNEMIFAEKIYSPGGGFIEVESEIHHNNHSMSSYQNPHKNLKYPFKNTKELLRICSQEKISIAELIFQNELTWRSAEEIEEKLDQIANLMREIIESGLSAQGVLPGDLKVKRRAPALYQTLSKATNFNKDPLLIMDWINVWGLAAAEENAAGGRVITAPTNGASGVIPAVLEYYRQYVEGADAKGIRNFLLTAGAIGLIYKRNASISGAEVGCQGEIGVACSMAAAGLAASQGATVEQIENAAEIGMEHFLGLTCDPVKGQVQIPCIERNAIAAVKAINASRMALRGDGSHFISLDQVVRTMLITGKDMQTKYKETSLGGLAVSIVEC